MSESGSIAEPFQAFATLDQHSSTDVVDTSHDGNMDTFLIYDDGDETGIPKNNVEKGNSSMVGASANMINSIVGAGIIGMPFALREAGFGFGVILIVVMGVITDFSVRVLVSSGVKVNKPNYQDLVLFALGPWGFRALSFGQFFFPLLGMMAYGIIVGQTMPKVFNAIWGDSFLDDPRVVIVIFTFTVMMPLSMLKKLEYLAKWSGLALFGVAVLILITCIEGNRLKHTPERGNVNAFFQTRFVQAIGVMAFAYVMHHNCFLVYASIKDTSIDKFSKVTHVSVGTAAVLSVILGVGGFYAFGNGTKDDVLDNFPDDNRAANAARFFFALAIMLTYPIECFVAREVIENYFFSEQQPPTNLRHYGVSFALCMLAMIVSVAVDKLGIILELNGIVNANLVAFILPGICGALLLDGEHWYQGQRLWSTLLAGFGIALFVFGVILVILEQAGVL
eukprot:TRINITY_DN9705_c0_g1_i6.p1 TRINITY_DN9705_c0_g1~~TRINITY_DN9705_c0_g1_i6.p1  ORF type:complete len:450 (+),score=105.19 TRINITY_DN9705_c0_g1_i6:152-1501(+)